MSCGSREEVWSGRSEMTDTEVVWPHRVNGRGENDKESVYER